MKQANRSASRNAGAVGQVVCDHGGRDQGPAEEAPTSGALLKALRSLGVDPNRAQEALAGADPEDARAVMAGLLLEEN